jgi:hypothetical protein
MNLSQMQFAYVPEQDRLLLRMNSDCGDEVRAWFTRRLVKLLWPNLMKVMAARVGQDNPAASAEARPLLLAMQRQSTLQQADFATPYREQACAFPLGAEPILVARVELTALPNRQTRIAIKPQQGAGIDLDMPDSMLHAFCETLLKAASKADWGLALVKDLSSALTQTERGTPRVVN